MSNYSNRIKQMTLGDVFDTSIDEFKKNFLSIIIITFLFSGFNSIILAFCEFNLSELDFQIVEILLTFLSWLLLQILIDNSIIKIIYESLVNNYKVRLGFSLKFSLKKYLNSFGYKILLLLIFVTVCSVMTFFIFLILGITSITTFGLTSFRNTDVIDTFTVFMYLIGFLLLIVLPILVSLVLIYIKIGFGNEAIVIDNYNSASSFAKSWSISKNGLWSIFLAYFFAGILFAGFAGILAYSILYLQKYNFYMFIVVKYTTQFVISILTSFVCTLKTVIYINQKIKNEALDFTSKLDRKVLEI